MLALTAAGIAILQQRATQEQQRIATARLLVAQADATRDTDSPTALRLGIAAQRIHPDGETQASLVNTLTTTRYAGTLTGHNGAVTSVAFSPHGPTLATGGDYGNGHSSVVLWDHSHRANLSPGTTSDRPWLVHLREHSESPRIGPRWPSATEAPP